MRRKTDRDILKENTWLICASCALIVLGILIGLWPYIFPEPDYDALEEREVTIQALRHFSTAENFPCIFAGIILY